LGDLRVEVGSGTEPLKGYFHIDKWPWSPHLEAIALMWRLPLPDCSASEVRAIHSLEHVEPPRLIATLEEWRRVLVTGGTLYVSVPNGPAIMAAFERASVPEKWPLIGSLLGMYCNIDDQDPSALTLRADHQIVFSRELLEWALREAGFTEIRDLTAEMADRHTIAWRSLVPQYSLIMRATAFPPGHPADGFRADEYETQLNTSVGAQEDQAFVGS